MINKLMKGFVDLIYGTERVKRKYVTNNPTEAVLASDASKSIMTSVNKDIQRGPDWVTSQRAVVLLTDTKIVCGKWAIPIENIKTAQLLKINSLFGGGQVLKVQTKDDEYFQFGMQINPEWTNQEILSLNLENARVKNSMFSIILRLFLIGYLSYWLYERFFQS